MTIQTEVVIVGAGPCGLFQVFELGLLGIKAQLLDSLDIPGGQCAELYPEKPIYDIPALPVCGAQELVDRLLEQIKPFGAGMHFGQEVTGETKRDDGRFDATTAGGLHFDAGAIVIAGGVGSFQPRRLGVDGADVFEGRQIFYRVRAAAEFHGAQLVIFGGGDSALDWTLALADKVASMTLVHRRADFRAAPASVTKMRELVDAGRMRFIEGTAQSLLTAGDKLSGVVVKDVAGASHELRADSLLAFFGLAPKLGPIAEWGLALEKKALLVDTEKFQTSVPGIFAVGDINTYPYPAKRQFLQYTTTSPVMHQRLGVGEAE